MRKSYCRIDYNKDCCLDYDYTICEWNEVSSQMEIAESSFKNISEEDNKNYKPEIKISLVFLTDKQFAKEMAKWDI